MRYEIYDEDTGEFLGDAEAEETELPPSGQRWNLSDVPATVIRAEYAESEGAVLIRVRVRRDRTA